jgi:hypothetical protein
MSPLRDREEERDVNARALLLGHIRLGTFNGKYPVPSETFVFTSVDRQRLEPLAKDFGGEIEGYKAQGAGADTWRLVSESDAFTALFAFPEVDGNLRQDYMLWRRSGLERICDGYEATVYTVDEEDGTREGEITACICKATEVVECGVESRLRFLLPQTGLGLWELNTGSKIAADDLFDQVRFISHAAQGRMNHVPIRAVLAPREITYVEKGKRKKATKRLVSLSVAGDAIAMLQGLQMEPNRALLSAVETALHDAGRELPSVSGARELEAGSESEPTPGGTEDVTSEEDPGEASEAEAGGLDEASGAEPSDVPEPVDGGGDEGPSTGPVGAVSGRKAASATEEAGPAVPDGPTFDSRGLTGDPVLDAPAPAEAWERAAAAGLRAGGALKIARKLWPDAGFRASHEITKGQLGKVIIAYLNGERGGTS